MFSRRTAFAAMASFGLLIGTPAYAQSEAPAGPILLTVTGAVENANRGGYDPDTDKFFGYNEVDFAKGAQFDYGALTDLEVVKIKADFPKGGDVHEYEGPLLVDVLKAAGAEGDTVTIQALDGYAVEMPLAEAVANGAVVALKRNGEPLSIGGFGPTHVVFPRADRADLADMPDDNWIWSIFHIKVE